MSAYIIADAKIGGPLVIGADGPPSARLLA